MYAVVRRYTGVPALITEMQRQGQSVEALLRSVPGFVAYYTLQTGNDLTTITVCDDQAGTAESTRRAAAWVQENVLGVTLTRPEVIAGEVFLQFSR